MTPAKREQRLSSLLRWAKEIPGPLRTLHREHGTHVHLRPTSLGVTLIGLEAGRPQRGKSGFRDLAELVSNFETSFEEHGRPDTHGRPTPEKELQSAMIRASYENGRAMVMLGEATRNTNDEVTPIFVTDELSMPTDAGGKRVCDLFAIRSLGGDVYRPMIIELKSKRLMKELVEQVVTYSAFVEEHLAGFQALASALLEREVRLEAECERWIVWPELNTGKPEGQVAKYAEQGIRVVTYALSGNEFTFCACDAPSVALSDPSGRSL